MSLENNRNYIINSSDKILVTGAAGFVGSKVVETLPLFGLKKIRCLVRSSSKLSGLQKIASGMDSTVEFVKGNLLDRNTCRAAVRDVSIIYHLAAGVEKSFPGCFLNSVVATRNLIDAALQETSLKRFVNISSIAVYTNQNIKKGGILDENCQIETKFAERFEAYTYGKAKQDELVIEYGNKFKLPHVIVRPSVVFGPGKAKISDRIGTDRFGIFLHLGLGNTIPLTYLDNCAEAIILAGLQPGVEGEVFNIIDDNLPTSRQFLRQYKKQVKKMLSIPVPYPLWYFFNTIWEKYSIWSEGQLPPVFNKRSCEIYWKRVNYSNKKAKHLLNWQPKIPMDISLNNFFNYMKSIQVNKQ